jgi:dTDP-4-amino-4,6-dideoxygalactose transaminase
VLVVACQAIGARRRIDGQWRHAGELGWVGAFSFFPSKNLGAWGDGGMIVTNDAATAERLRRLRLHGGAKQYHHEEVGTNSRLDTLQAVVLLRKLPHLADWSARRRAHAATYTAAFADLAAVRTPVVDDANEHIFHQYTLRVGARRARRPPQGAQDRARRASRAAAPAGMLRPPALYARVPARRPSARAARSSRCRSTRSSRRPSSTG